MCPWWFWNCGCSATSKEVKCWSLAPSELLSNFQVAFLYKVLEKVVAKQLLDDLENNGHQSASALLRVTNDLLVRVHAGMGSVFILLYLSVACHRVDHHILIDRLREWAEIFGTALKWFSIVNHSFSLSKCMFGVPQGSALGLVSFSCAQYIIHHHGISFHLCRWHPDIPTDNSTDRYR